MPVSITQEHGTFVSDRIDIEERSGDTLAFTAAADQTAALAEGLYDVSANQNCWIKVAPTANDVAANTGYRLIANNVITVLIRQGSKIGAIRDTADGSLWFHKVG